MFSSVPQFNSMFLVGGTVCAAFAAWTLRRLFMRRPTANFPPKRNSTPQPAPMANPKPVSRLALLVHRQHFGLVASLGASWDRDTNRWYVLQNVDPTPFEEWIDFVDESRGSLAFYLNHAPQRSAYLKRSDWFSSLRADVKDADWDLVKAKTFQNAGHQCEICRGRGDGHPVECHELWRFDYQTQVQTLIGTMSLCPKCHATTHFGLAHANGVGLDTRKHLCSVHGWDEDVADRHIAMALGEWKRRSRVRWSVDARWLIDFVPLSVASKGKLLSQAANCAGLGKIVAGTSAKNTNLASSFSAGSGTISATATQQRI